MVSAMKSCLTTAKLRVKKSPLHGYGVFAEEEIKPDQIIEECYILKSENGDPNLWDYYFDIDNKYGLLLGYGCIYNHSDQPNAIRTYDEKNQLYVFTADRLIRKGEEILISYGENWFSSRQRQTKQSSWWFKVRKYASSLSYIIRFAIISGALLFLLKINILSILKMQ